MYVDSFAEFEEDPKKLQVDGIVVIACPNCRKDLKQGLMKLDLHLEQLPEHQHDDEEAYHIEIDLLESEFEGNDETQELEIKGRLSIDCTCGELAEEALITHVANIESDFVNEK